jgi:hypothetical protein
MTTRQASVNKAHHPTQGNRVNDPAPVCRHESKVSHRVRREAKPPKTTEKASNALRAKRIKVTSVVLGGFASRRTRCWNLPLLHSRRCWPVRPLARLPCHPAYCPFDGPLDPPASRRHRLAPHPRKHDMQSWEVGGGRAPRQPGQVRKEAAAVSFRSGRFAGLPPVETQPPGGRRGG